jgi:hypothetical protein
MGFRDDSEALRARIGVLEAELDDAREQAARAAELARELEATKERLAALEAEQGTEREKELAKKLFETKRELAEAKAATRPPTTPRVSTAGAVLGLGVLLFLSVVAWKYVTGRREPAPDLVRSEPLDPVYDPYAEPVGRQFRYGVVRTSTVDTVTVGQRCEVELSHNEVVVLRCAERELQRGWAPCSHHRARATRCRTPEGETSQIDADFERETARFTTPAGSITVALEPQAPE